jgi:hypothetical protein
MDKIQRRRVGSNPGISEFIPARERAFPENSESKDLTEPLCAPYAIWFQISNLAI